ncbi:hypothetical protein [Roseimaritima ulvae]|uniref:Secreted protein n=1 Tax=Roseimaritima ulvae TaxID=980254 RepID=A0A5B9QN45_9BACT|nr:hypothetical protein [Roseimaritima ulvae]QEG40517.1 hypothetical protein UC8_25310 [Roseimaritima ulvae]
MVRVMLCAAVIAAACFANNLQADEKNGECLAEGDPIGAFYVTKVAGAEDDGVEAGQELCYRCRYGGRPMVMVFARKNSEKLNQLVGKLDKAVASHSDNQLKSFVTLVGADTETLKKEASKLASSTSVKGVPVVIAKDNENGPRNYKLDSKADVTVVIANNSQVVSNQTYTADDVDADAVIAAVEKAIK